MVYIPGGTFCMGSDRQYPAEAPVHRVTVDGFWMDRTPVTNRQFREFFNATRALQPQRLPEAFCGRAAAALNLLRFRRVTGRNSR